MLELGDQRRFLELAHGTQERRSQHCDHRPAAACRFETALRVMVVFEREPAIWESLIMAKSHTVDVHVGARMRQRRTLLGMSQSKLGDAVGLTFQQIQKYEHGANRIGSSRLFEFAKVLDVPVSHFFEQMPANALSGRRLSSRGRKSFGEASTPFEQDKDPLIKRETLELVRAYYKIRNARVRKRIFEMVEAVGAASRAEVLAGRKRH
jgi:transcriptional regulator with XRE-family HTH domain